ncbi:MAG: TVP38/TMEM64 family protein [Promethearchaeota archaeon]
MSNNNVEYNENTNTAENSEENAGLISKLINVIKRTFEGHSKKTWVWIIIFLVISLVTVYLLYKQYTDKNWLFSIVINYFVIPIRKLGFWGWTLFIAFMGIQGILLPIPSELVLLSSGLIWGLWGGTLLGIVGSLFAGWLTFYISLKGGRPLAEKFVGAENIALVDKLIDKYGTGLIVVARAFPFIAFDPISYASGLLKIKMKPYLIATFLGSIIRCLFYSFLGAQLITEGYTLDDIIANPTLMDTFINQGADRFNQMLLIIIVVLLVMFLLYQYVLIPRLRKKREQLINEEKQKADGGSNSSADSVDSEDSINSSDS